MTPFYFVWHIHLTIQVITKDDKYWFPPFNFSKWYSWLLFSCNYRNHNVQSNMWWYGEFCQDFCLLNFTFDIVCELIMLTLSQSGIMVIRLILCVRGVICGGRSEFHHLFHYVCFLICFLNWGFLMYCLFSRNLHLSW